MTGKELCNPGGNDLSLEDRAFTAVGFFIGSSLFWKEVSKANKLIGATKVGKYASSIFETVSSFGSKTKKGIADLASTAKGIITRSKVAGAIDTPVIELFEGITKEVGKDGADFVRGIPKLTFTGKGTWISEAGIAYGLHPKTGENRLRHILRHLKPDPTKWEHSVFTSSAKEIPKLIDEAWLKKVPLKETMLPPMWLRWVGSLGQRGKQN